MNLPVVGDQVPRRNDPKTQRLGIWILKRLGWEVRGEVPNVPKLVLIGAPHTSNRDGLVAMSLVQALQIRIEIMGKDSLFKTPGLSHFLRWLGIFPIDRRSPQGLVEQSAQRIKSADRLWLGLAPEGTRNRALTWKNGFHRIALLAEVPIVMVAMDFGRRELRFSDVLSPSDSYEADLQKVLHFFADAEACCPEMLSLPLTKIRQARMRGLEGRK